MSNTQPNGTILVGGNGYAVSTKQTGIDGVVFVYQYSKCGTTVVQSPARSDGNGGFASNADATKGKKLHKIAFEHFAILRENGLEFNVIS